MDQLRVGIVGCGEVAQIIHLPALYRLAEKFRVTALCDASQSVLDGVGDRWQVQKRYLQYEELLADPSVDVVLVANPHAYHTPVTLAAMAQGKHVLVEKPAAMNLAEADALLAAEARTGVTVQVAYMRRYAPAFEQACTIVGQMQAAGDIRLARVHDVIGHNSQIIAATSRVLKGQDIPPDVLAAGRQLEAAGIQAALGDAPPAVRGAYMLMLGLSSHDISAMRELLGMPQRVLCATQRDGLYLTATFDYGSFVCQFDTGVDYLARFDANLEVFGQQKYVRVQYDTPYVLNLPIRLFVNEWLALYANITERRIPKTSLADYRQDLELFRDMAALMQ